MVKKNNTNLHESPWIFKGLYGALPCDQVLFAPQQGVFCQDRFVASLVSISSFCISTLIHVVWAVSHMTWSVGKLTSSWIFFLEYSSKLSRFALICCSWLACSLAYWLVFILLLFNVGHPLLPEVPEPLYLSLRHKLISRWQLNNGVMELSWAACSTAPQWSPYPPNEQSAIDYS